MKRGDEKINIYIITKNGVLLRKNFHDKILNNLLENGEQNVTTVLGPLVMNPQKLLKALEPNDIVVLVVPISSENNIDKGECFVWNDYKEIVEILKNSNNENTYDLLLKYSENTP